MLSGACMMTHLKSGGSWALDITAKERELVRRFRLVRALHYVKEAVSLRATFKFTGKAGSS